MYGGVWHQEGGSEGGCMVGFDIRRDYLRG